MQPFCFTYVKHNMGNTNTMNLITITAIDMHSSDSMSRTLSVENLKKGIKDFEKDITYSRYELMTEELIEEYSEEVINTLDELDVDYL